MSKYVLKSGADVNGTFLVAHLDDVTREDMVRSFGKSLGLGYIDSEKGYDGDEWTFVTPEGQVFNVYSRFDSFRIGSTSENSVSDFKAWLLATIQASFTA